ncbi:TPA: hypothetical protein QEM49_000244 [Pseudomonas putida]|uniref:YtcA family lipoprotein n=1 Tax=Pseudomonas putida TaxID=303 RepID=UPI0023637A98|nr:YtcA family lipoprotein [Pseudomonas putida]MDD2008320.1 YtcA family lipoprotein [Pseudomonas putida]HDS1775785.1 hypothetical protein [Pseudomonas putida]
MRSQAILFFLCALLGGCSAAPSINVLGAYFPDWMFCIVGAIVATGVVHAALRAAGLLRQSGGSTPLAYSSMTVLLALVGWLIFFNN